MSQWVDTPTKGFVAGGAVAQHLRVKLTSGKLAVAGLADREIGTITEEAFADGDIRAVRLVSAQGTTKMVAGATLNAGDNVFTAANGKVAASATNAFFVGVTLEGGADGEIIEVLRNGHGAVVTA